MKRLLLCLILAAGCSSDPEETPVDAGNTTADSGGSDSGVVSTPDMGSAADDGTSVDQGTDAAPDPADMGTEADMAAEVLMESEPNNGTSVDEVNDLPAGMSIAGAIEDGDSDVFFVDAPANTLLEIDIELPAGSALQPHVAVFDAGRDGDPAGDDYVKIGRGTTVQVFVMGEGGYFVAVRDARVVDGGNAGGPDHNYVLTARAAEPSPAPDTVDFPSTLQGTLSGPGGVDLYAFDGTEGMNVRFDFAATGEVDGRLWVYSYTQGDWIARQDDRSLGDPNPLLDAPLFANGPMLLVVENITEQASSLGYTIDATSP